MNKPYLTDKEILIRCNDLGKRFCRDLKRSLWYGVQDMTHDFFGLEAPADSMRPQRPRLRPKEFWAVEDISFEVRRGQCLGLIGKNGAGKTTILKMLSGIIKPDCGKIELRGRVGGLIALGAGFNPLLTGRENTYVNGAILGFTRQQINAKMEEIEAFADIGEFMDAPVQGYSSGMSVRLGFAIAAILTKPDVLLLDEVLAVGDMGFIIKCLNAVQEMAERSAVIFVSHNMQFVSRFCTDVMVLKNGQIELLTSDVSRGIGVYMECFETKVGVAGMGGAKVLNVNLRVITKNPNRSHEHQFFRHGDHVLLEYDVCFEHSDTDHVTHIQIDDQTSNPIVTYPNIPLELCSNPKSNMVRYSVPLGKMEMNAGRYSVVIIVAAPDNNRCFVRHQGAATFTLVDDEVHWGAFVKKLTVHRANE